ncbi:hypothetical protein MHU86_25436 [Fragilaria crotonensis]|nr:hypothetical protein MHU86_25436 [Fragilaria crotonensis]
MARSRRGGGGGFGGSSRPVSSSARPQQRSVPAPRPAAPPAPMQQQSSGGGMLSGIGSTIAQGMAFGTGSAIAHRAVGAVAGAMSGGGSEQAPAQQYDNQPMQQQQLQGACVQDKQMFFECLQVNKGDQQSCSFLYDNLQACQRGDNAMSFN